MDKAYWAAREQAELAAAHAAASPRARLIHLELARRYGMTMASHSPVDDATTEAADEFEDVAAAEPASPHSGSLFRSLTHIAAPEPGGTAQ
ncbi:hypothetical protein GCM10023232_19970 [Sphingosinicella ginsenosidimutans]|jgi:hypothetical protein|uniref:Uncharacterized protein n=1 Tax=Allosphingosinicella ginsenosidimutans TaxID=1176539 RepID=A0A5C6TS56_9SPHN|nr:hypothetical protein [Sphingosinicella ginsenosidimutans]TXC63020.1 hypothetical protein FRZ32_04665 [Sphingosinicella ginsenosidimutans]